MLVPLSRRLWGEVASRLFQAEAVTNDRRPNLASRCLSRFCSSSKDSTKAPSTEAPPGKPVKEAHSTPSKKPPEVARKDIKPAKPGPKPPAASQGSVATPKAGVSALPWLSGIRARSGSDSTRPSLKLPCLRRRRRRRKSSSHSAREVQRFRRSGYSRRPFRGT